MPQHRRCIGRPASRRDTSPFHLPNVTQGAPDTARGGRAAVGGPRRRGSSRVDRAAAAPAVSPYSLVYCLFGLMLPRPTCLTVPRAHFPFPRPRHHRRMQPRWVPPLGEEAPTAQPKKKNVLLKKLGLLQTHRLCMTSSPLPSPALCSLSKLPSFPKTHCSLSSRRKG
ncbi:hypothetical protein VUR80DRAFT_7529 [Thermomyces stellatus]